MHLGSGHGIRVRGSNDVFGPIPIRTDEDEFVLQFLPIGENFFPGGGDEQLIYRDRFIIKIRRSRETKKAGTAGGNTIGIAGFFQHPAGEGSGHGVLELAAIVGPADNPVTIRPEVDVADPTVGIILGDFRGPQGSKGGWKG